MALGDQVGKDAVDELTSKTIPELLDGLNKAIDKFDSLLSRLDGASLVLVLKKE